MKQISTPNGLVYRHSPGFPLRPGERAIFSTAADITLAEFMALVAEMHDYDGEPATDVPEAFTWTLRVECGPGRTR